MSLSSIPANAAAITNPAMIGPVHTLTHSGVCEGPVRQRPMTIARRPKGAWSHAARHGPPHRVAPCPNASGAARGDADLNPDRQSWVSTIMFT
eukprot:gene53623-33152_t